MCRRACNVMRSIRYVSIRTVVNIKKMAGLGVMCFPLRCALAAHYSQATPDENIFTAEGF